MRKLNVEEMGRLSAEEFREAEKMPLVVVLDNVRSLYNVGSVFRTADAYRVERVVLCGITATPPDAEIHKTALGAEFTVDWVHYKDTTEAVRCLKAEGYHVYAVEQTEGSVMLGDFHAEEGGRYAVILGNEVKGVRQEAIDLCEGCIELPQYGTKHSLNVSVTAGIVMWELSKQLLPHSLR